MYTAFYGFRQKPFNLVPDPSFLYLSPKHRMALAHLRYGLMDRIGFVLLTGEIGTGKTTIVKQFLKEVGPDIEVALVFNTNVASHQLLALILNEFGIEAPGPGKPGLLDALNQFLIDKYALGQRALLIVDEAQNLSEAGLEEIRMLSNLQTDRESLLQILLVGQPALRLKLQRPSLAQLSQRIAVSCHISPLSLEETRAYIAYRLEKAGASGGQVFTPEAVTRIFEHSGGIPRTINMLCDGALVYGYADELKTIDVSVIEQLVRDKNESDLLTQPDVASQMHSTEQDGDESLPRRIESLEAQVGQLAATLDRLVQTHEQAGPGKGESALVRRFETRLVEERGRTNELRLRCHSLQAQLDALPDSSEPEAPASDAKGAGIAVTEPEERGERQQSPDRWSRRAVNALRRWLLP
jgi:general secretion pathway protein A